MIISACILAVCFIAWASYQCGRAQGRIDEAENRFKKSEKAEDLRQLNDPYGA